VTLYEDCTGTCAIWQKFGVGGGIAFTAGHSIFFQGPRDDVTLRHEMTHVRQGDEYGWWWIPAYALENLRHVPDCWFSAKCYERLNRFEIEARNAAHSDKEAPR